MSNDQDYSGIFRSDTTKRRSVYRRTRSEVDMSHPNYAGFWIRFGAALLDAVIFMVAGGMITTGLGLFLKIEYLDYIIEFLSLIFWIYMTGIHGGTPGKLALGLRVVNKKGNFIGIPNAIVRYIGRVISGLLLCFGFFMIGWDPKKQGLHDKMAHTYVVKI